MIVETYEVTEQIEGELAAADEAEAVAIAERLGLKGQRAIRTPEAGRVVFPKLTLEQDRILAVLCPQRQLVGDYDAPMPVRILRLVEQHAPAFKRLEVWAPSDPRVPDPVLVGVTGDPVNTWLTTTFLLARWGDQLDDWDTLRATAGKRLAATWRHAALGFKMRAEAILADPSSAVEAYLLGVGDEPAVVTAAGQLR